MSTPLCPDCHGTLQVPIEGTWDTVPCPNCTGAAQPTRPAEESPPPEHPPQNEEPPAD